MFLIADSGSTKTNWTLVKESQISLQFESEGYNPCYNSRKEIMDSLYNSLPQGYVWNDIKLVAFYGAGCYEDKFTVIEDALRPLFPNARFDIAMDLMASARALLGSDPGFAAILGTGTNSCLYNGKKITHNIDSMGFLLGDEGSGAYMGKRLIGDFIRGRMPFDIRNYFYDIYKLSPDELIDQVYTNSMPNRFCGSFTRFLSQKLVSGHDYIENLKRESFRDFFKNIVIYYPDYSYYLFNCVGSIGWVFKDTLTVIVEEFGMKVGEIIQNPMEGLIAYHEGQV